MSRALNRAVKNMATNAKREISKNYEINQKIVGDTLKINQAKRNKLYVQLTSTGYKMGLNKFKYSPKKPNPSNPPKEIKISVKKGNQHRFRHVFVANLNGFKLFERTGKFRVASKGSHKGKKRENIKRLLGPAVPQMLNNPKVRKVVVKEGQNTYRKRLEHEINRVLGGVSK